MPKPTNAGRKTNQQTQQYYGEEANQYKQFQDFLNSLFSGSYDKSQEYMGNAYGKYNDMYGSYGDVARTGLAGEYAKSRGFYDDLMKTGGFTPQQQGQYRRQALAPTSGYWDAFKQQYENRNAINPYNPGYSAGQSKIARDTGHQMESAGISAENSLQDMIRQGKLSGASGEERIAGNINTNKLAGMGGQMGATAGIAGLGESEQAFAKSMVDSMLQNRGIDASTRSGLLSLMAQMNPQQPDFWDRFLPLWSSGKQAAGSAAGRRGP